jgi:hypothetical protein
MGVDASLYLKTSRKYSEEELKDLNFRFKEASGFGDNDFPITKQDYQRDGEDYYEVYSFSRYYGEGYERGHWPEIYMAIKWLQNNFEGATIYYGGDTYDHAEDFETPEFTEEREKELLEHWYKNGGIPYRMHSLKEVSVNCSVHEKPMSQAMWGGGKIGLVCLACGRKKITEDGGKTSKELDKNENF